MTETDWLRYFRANSAEPRLPWDDGYRLSGAERTVVIESIQQFQLGENAQGRRLLERARALDAHYAAALRLFIQEEQRHSYFLGRFLALQGEGCLSRHWIHASFRRLRGFAGLELRMRVLATAEVLAITYYTALREATGSTLLKSGSGTLTLAGNSTGLFAGTATVAGTAATAGLELVRLMVDPMVGAGPFIVTTFDAREWPPTTFFADSITEKGVAGLTVSWAILVMP